MVRSLKVGKVKTVLSFDLFNTSNSKVSIAVEWDDLTSGHECNTIRDKLYRSCKQCQGWFINQSKIALTSTMLVIEPSTSKIKKRYLQIDQNF
jgi:hypothetical protein